MKPKYVLIINGSRIETFVTVKGAKKYAREEFLKEWIWCADEKSADYFVGTPNVITSEPMLAEIRPLHQPAPITAPITEIMRTLESSSRMFAAEYYARLSEVQKEKLTMYLAMCRDCDKADARMWLDRTFTRRFK